MDLISLILSKNASGGSATEKTVIYDGTPTKMDLTSAGMGYAYLLSSEDLLSLAYGQNVHFEYKLADGTIKRGVLYKYNYMNDFSAPIIYGEFTLLYVPLLGGTGISFDYADAGEFINLQLWTEYDENKPYYVTGYYDGTKNQFFFVDHKKARVAGEEMRLNVRHVDAGGNMVYLTPTRVLSVLEKIDVKLNNIDSSSLQQVTITDGQPTAS